MLNNFPHINAYWQMLGAKIAHIALRFGADDIDGTVVEEKFAAAKALRAVATASR